MALKIRNRALEPNLKKILIYGLDGSGKSTFAEEFCRQNGLNPVVIDIDDTNYTNLPIVDIDMGTDVKTYNNIKQTIAEIGRTDYDTIILDGCTSLLEMLTSKAKGMAAYSDRSKRWNDILRALLASKKNLIFIGQIDMEVIYTPDNQSSKAVIKVNSMVNEKYLTYIDKDGNYKHEVKKYRTLQQVEAEASPPKPEPEPEPVTVEPEPVTEDIGFETADELPLIESFVRSIIAQLKDMGKPVNKNNILKCSYQSLQEKEISAKEHKEVISWCKVHCPEDIDEIVEAIA